MTVEGNGKREQLLLLSLLCCENYYILGVLQLWSRLYFLINFL
jgi:hypothetical protein